MSRVMSVWRRGGIGRGAQRVAESFVLIAVPQTRRGWSLLVDPEAIRVLSSPLLGDDEIGELASLTITFRANQNGGTHAAECRHVSVRGGGRGRQRIAGLTLVLETRLQQECKNAAGRRPGLRRVRELPRFVRHVTNRAKLRC